MPTPIMSDEELDALFQRGAEAYPDEMPTAAWAHMESKLADNARPPQRRRKAGSIIAGGLLLLCALLCWQMRDLLAPLPVLQTSQQPYLPGKKVATAPATAATSTEHAGTEPTSAVPAAGAVSQRTSLAQGPDFKHNRLAITPASLAAPSRTTRSPAAAAPLAAQATADEAGQQAVIGKATAQKYAALVKQPIAARQPGRKAGDGRRVAQPLLVASRGDERVVPTQMAATVPRRAKSVQVSDLKHSRSFTRPAPPNQLAPLAARRRPRLLAATTAPLTALPAHAAAKQPAGSGKVERQLAAAKEKGVVARLPGRKNRGGQLAGQLLSAADSVGSVAAGQAKAAQLASAERSEPVNLLDGRVASLAMPSCPLPTSLRQFAPQRPAADSTAPRCPAPRPPYRVVVGLLAGPGFSGVRTARTAQLGLDYGLTLEYRFSTRLRVRVGLLSSQKRYQAASTDYQAPTAWKWYTGTYELAANCRVTEIPLDLRYDVLSRPRHTLFASLGVNSLLMRNERYSYDWTMNGQTSTKSAQVINGSNHFLSVLNFAVGFEKPLGQRWSAQVEPFWQLPLSGVGAGQVRLTSAGASFSLKYGLLR